MKLSMILTGRNDNYGGRFRDRLDTTVRYNLREFQRHGIDCELVFVEWNPPRDRELLAHAVTQEFPEAACFVVDHEVHRHICENRHIELYEYYAKNIGAARAAGDWLLVTNPDIVFGQDVFETLATGALDETTMYRASFARIHELSEMAQAEAVDLDQTAPFHRHAGDFICCHRRLFDQVGGFREDLPFTNTFKDALFCKAAFAATGKARKIGTVYHMEHERDNHARRRLEFDVDRIPLTPQSRYGLADICEAVTLAERVVQLKLRPEWRSAAAEKQLPEPVVPRHLRKLPKLVRILRNQFLRKSA